MTALMLRHNLPPLKLARAALRAQRTLSAGIAAHHALVGQALDIANDSDDLDDILPILEQAALNAEQLNAQAKALANQLQHLVEGD